MHRPMPCAYTRAVRDSVVRMKVTMDSAIDKLGDSRMVELRAEVQAMAERIFQIDDELQFDCRVLMDRDDFDDMREGRIPYPMEIDFVPVCDCATLCNACSDKVPQYRDPDGDAVGRIRHTCTEPCPVHGFA